MDKTKSRLIWAVFWVCIILPIYAILSYITRQYQYMGTINNVMWTCLHWFWMLNLVLTFSWPLTITWDLLLLPNTLLYCLCSCRDILIIKYIQKLVSALVPLARLEKKLILPRKTTQVAVHLNFQLEISSSSFVKSPLESLIMLFKLPNSSKKLSIILSILRLFEMH